MSQFLPYAWAVEFGKDLRAVFTERPRAEQYASDSHGLVVPLYDLRPAGAISNPGSGDAKAPTLP